MTKRFAFVDAKDDGSIDITLNGGKTTHFFGPLAGVFRGLIRMVCSHKGGPYADGEVGVCPGKDGDSLTVIWEEEVKDES